MCGQARRIGGKGRAGKGDPRRNRPWAFPNRGGHERFPIVLPRSTCIGHRLRCIGPFIGSIGGAEPQNGVRRNGGSPRRSLETQPLFAWDGLKSGSWHGRLARDGSWPRRPCYEVMGKMPMLREVTAKMAVLQ